jgi:hypothetical protein
MKNLIKREIQSTLNELNEELNNSTNEERDAFYNAVYFIGIVIILSLFIL